MLRDDDDEPSDREPAGAGPGDSRNRYVENRGGFLSAGANLPPTVRTAIGLALFLAGGASNWIDRVVRGSVIDFLNVGIGPVRTGVFNVADVAIMLGVAIIAFVGYREQP